MSGEKLMSINDLNVNETFTTTIPKFIPLFDLVNDNDLKFKLQILSFNNIQIERPSQWKVFALPLKELQRRITIVKSNGTIGNIIYNPLLLLDSSLYYVRQRNIILSEELEKIFSGETKSSLTEKNFNNYSNLLKMQKAVLEKLDYDILASGLDVDSRISWLVSIESYSNYEILFYAFSVGMNLKYDEQKKLEVAIESVVNNILFNSSRKTGSRI